jgi:hypothetical protein
MGVFMKNHVLNEILNICHRHRQCIDEFHQTGNMTSKLFNILFDEFMQIGIIPVNIATGIDCDPYLWIAEKLREIEFEIA